MILCNSVTLKNILKIISLMVFMNNCCFAVVNNHNNKYDPNTIYTSSQYLVDHDLDLIRQEKQVMQLIKTLSNAKSQTSIGFKYSINLEILKLTKQNKIISLNEFRGVIDSIIMNSIESLPSKADEVVNLNKILTEYAIDSLLGNIVKNNINIKEHNLLLLDDKDRNIFGNNYNNNKVDLGIIKYKNKTCTFNNKLKDNTYYYTVNLK